jgi:hypothetical protein
MDSLVAINISLESVGLINTEISNACVSVSDAVYKTSDYYSLELLPDFPLN